MHVVALGRAPIKGCRRESLLEVRVDADGVRGDRSLAFVAEGAVLRTVANPGLLGLHATLGHDEGQQVVHLTLPDGTSASQRIVPGERGIVDYWGRPLPVELLPGDVSDAAGAHLGRAVVLAAIERPSRAIYANPVSIGLVSRFAGLGCDAERFRCNVLVDDTDDPRGEDAWVGRGVRLGGVVLVVRKRLERCPVIDHDPVTGERDRRLFAELSAGPDPLVGLGADVVRGGVLAVGDRVGTSGGLVYR